MTISQPPLPAISPPTTSFRESGQFGTPIRNLGLSITGTWLEPIIREFEEELRDKGIVKLHPLCHLSTEWGVPFGGISIGIPFYLARPDLTALHGDKVGHIEGMSRTDVLRYLRHEMGHVVNYAYKLYEDEEWVKQFGSMTQPYVEDYRPEPFSQRFVRHLPGWYAQKHPDEDWSETFAIWLTPLRNWREDYAEWPVALAKLVYCDKTMQRLQNIEPLVTSEELDEDVAGIDYSLEQFYSQQPAAESDFSPGLDGALRAIFEDLYSPEGAQQGTDLRSAAALIRQLEMPLLAESFRWTGHFPERTRGLIRHLARRAEALQQVYPAERERETVLAITVFITSLAMNYVHRGSYFPAPQEKPAST